MFIRSFVYRGGLAATFLCMAALAVVSANVLAATPEETLAQAEGFFAQRADLAKNDKAIALLEALVKQAASADVKYKAHILASRAYYWKADNVAGSEENNDAKVVVFQKGMDMAAAAKAVNKEPAEAYYFFAINLGKWALAKGPLKVLARKGELMKNLDEVVARKTLAQTSGEEFDFYGANRVRGKMYYKLPKVAGGNVDKAIKNLEVAVARGGDHVLNHVFMAEALIEAGSKDQARKVLDALLSRDVSTFPAVRAPETARELGQARALRAKL
jgi:hypothetical protein